MVQGFKSNTIQINMPFNFNFLKNNRRSLMIVDVDHDIKQIHLYSFPKREKKKVMEQYLKLFSNIYPKYTIQE